MNKWTAWILSAALCAVLMGCAEQTASPGGAADSTPETAAAGAADGVPDDAEDGTEGQDGTAQGAVGNEAVTEAYQAFVAELEQAGGEELSWVQIPSGTGENLLVVAKTSSVYFEGESTEADIYQYADGTVRRLTSVSSTGTAYPLAYTEEAVLFGGNHQSGKLAVHEGTGELSLLTNMNIEGRTPVLEVYAVEDGEQTLVSREELTAEEADAYDYYMNALADEDAEIIVFS